MVVVAWAGCMGWPLRQCQAKVQVCQAEVQVSQAGRWWLMPWL